MITIELKYNVTQIEEGFTITHILKDKLFVSNRLLIKLKMNQKILVNDLPVFSNHIVHTGDYIKVKLDFEETDFITPEKIELDILYEDEYFLAVNKPAGMVVHPSANHLSGTLANGVKYYLNNKKRIRPINRLDRDTSGIVLFAKNEYIQELMIKNVVIQKEYIAIVDGIIEEKSGTINAPIARKPGSIMERCISEEGQTAITHYEVLNEILHKNESYKGNQTSKLSVVKLKLETGRTHQIRVHLAYLGNPIIGDTLYGNESNLIKRQALHAYLMEFNHPILNKRVLVQSGLPADMKIIIQN